jgi:ElaB/YqjD/DUF883 family membrane-anchored ribosome-binding protein
MKTSNLDSKRDTATTLPAARQHTIQNKSEERFLADQSTNARTAMVQTVSEMKRTLSKLTDVRTCARRHPWIATGSAVAAGFVAGAILPGRRSTSAEKIPAKANAVAPPDSNGHDPLRAKPSLMMSTLGTVLTSVVKTLLQSFIATAIVANEVDQVKDKPPMPGSSTASRSTPGDSTRPAASESATP